MYGDLVFARAAKPAAWAQNIWLMRAWCQRPASARGPAPSNAPCSANGGAPGAPGPPRRAHHRKSCPARLRATRRSSASLRPRRLAFHPVGRGEHDRRADLQQPVSGRRAALVEDRESAPSRAYLKLWEALTLLGVQPGRASCALDPGPAPAAGPVLASLGAGIQRGQGRARPAHRHAGGGVGIEQAASIQDANAQLNETGIALLDIRTAQSRPESAQPT